MKKSTLLTIRDIIQTIETSNRNLYDMLDLLNITPEERITIENAMLVTLEKIEMIKQSKLSELNQHIDVDYIDTRYNY